MSAKSDRNQESLRQQPPQRTKRRLGLAQGNPLDFQRLEDRNLLAAITVTNSTDLTNADTSSITALMSDDGGDGISLREAIVAANNTTGDDTITFDGSVFNGGANSLIRLTQGELEITETLTIDASTATDVTITGDANGDDVTLPGTFVTDVEASFGGESSTETDLLDDNFRLINFIDFYAYAQPANLTLQNLTLTGGRTRFNNRFAFSSEPIDTTHSGGGIRFFSEGTLTISQSTVAGNSTLGARAGGGGIATDGGIVVLTDSVLTGNSTSGVDALGGGGFAASGDLLLTNVSVNGNSTSGSEAGGGGIATVSGNIVLTDSTVVGNSTHGVGSFFGRVSGGGIFSDFGNVTLINSTVSRNSTHGEGAGGGGIATEAGDVFVIDSVVSENSTYGGGDERDGARGGGIFASEGNVTLTNSVVSGNSTHGRSAMGGGIAIGGFFQDSSLNVANSTITGNSTNGDRAGGGGIASEEGVVALVDSAVVGNSTAGEFSSGGGIYARGGPVSVSGSTLSGNSTIGLLAKGGGLFAWARSRVYFANSTVSGNSTAGDRSDGGGIAVISGGSFSSYNSTFSDNRAIGSVGGGIYGTVGVSGTGSSTTIRLQNSIVAGNSDDGTAPDLFGFNDVSIDFSLIADATGSNVDQSTGVGNILNQPALLGPLADNGGATMTHALLPASPAIDAGGNTMTVDIIHLFIDTSDFFGRAEFGLVDLTNDQRGDGFDRIQFGRVDIGAFESDFDAPPIAPRVLSATIDGGRTLARPDLWNTLSVVFDVDVNVTADDLLLVNDSLGGSSVDLTGVSFDYDSRSATATWDFTTLDSPLDPAFYIWRLNAAGITAEGLSLDGDGDGIGGDDFIGQHYVAIPGDANLDGVVDVLNDAFTLVGNLGSTTNLAWADGDFNGDGSVTVLGDAFVLVSNLGRDVRPPVALAASSSSSSVTTSLALESLSDTDEQDEVTGDAKLVATSAQSPRLALAGDHELRDDVFGSDF